MKIDLFCLDFHSAFRLRDFSLQCQLYIFSECVPVIKEKATQPGPRQQAKVDTNVIETGYWYSPCWLPAHLGRSCVFSAHWAWSFSLSWWVFCSFMFSVCAPANCCGPLSLLIFMPSRFSHDWFSAYLSKWHLNEKSGPVWLLKL